MNRQELATHLDIEVRTLEVWIEQDWLVPATMAAGPQFSATDVARAHLIQDLQKGFGVNDEGIDIILHLLDQLHGVRRAFEDVHAEMKGGRG